MKDRMGGIPVDHRKRNHAVAINSRFSACRQVYAGFAALSQDRGGILTLLCGLSHPDSRVFFVI